MLSRLPSWALWAVAIAGSAVLLVLAFWPRGGDGGLEAPGTPFASEIAEAAERTAALPGSRISFTGSVGSPQIPGGMTMRGSGEFNGQTQRGRLEMTASAPGIPGGGFSMTQVSDGFTFFMTSPLLGGMLPDGKSWLKLDLGDTFGSGGSAALGTGVDPAQQLDSLRAVSDAVSDLGTERVRGVVTHRYSATISLERQLDLLRDEGEDEAADALEKLSEAGGAAAFQAPVEVWIDEQGLVRRQAMSIPFGALGGAGAGAQASMTMELFDFGAKPDIALPPESEVLDATDLAEGGFEQLLG